MEYRRHYKLVKENCKLPAESNRCCSRVVFQINKISPLIFNFTFSTTNKPPHCETAFSDTSFTCRHFHVPSRPSKNYFELEWLFLKRLRFSSSVMLCGHRVPATCSFFYTGWHLLKISLKQFTGCAANIFPWSYCKSLLTILCKYTSKNQIKL